MPLRPIGPATVWIDDPMERLQVSACRLLAMAALALAGVSVGAAAWAQAGIYTCIDAQGRRITSDRPIPDCLDRPQRELNRSGTTKRVVPPSPTAEEREAQAAREREARAARQRARDAIRRDQALLARYPDPAAHEASRQEALAQTLVVVAAAGQRIVELELERARLDDEMEFYVSDPSRAPAKLLRDIESNKAEVAEQHRAIANQEEERRRINARFDEEAAHLRDLWPEDVLEQYEDQDGTAPDDRPAG